MRGTCWEPEARTGNGKGPTDFLDAQVLPELAPLGDVALEDAEVLLRGLQTLEHRPCQPARR